MKLCIATPLYENTHVMLGYHQAVMKLKQPGVDILDFHQMTFGLDLVRKRSLALEMAYEAGYDHLLFWDADVMAPPDQCGTAIRNMLSTGFDLVGAPYPKKRIHWDRVAAAVKSGITDAEGLQRSAYEFPVYDVNPAILSNGCVPCRYLHMGFTLISRKLMKMVLEAPEFVHLRFKDRSGGEWKTRLASFALLINGEGLLLSEDFSFCERAIMLGVQPMLYVDEGSRLHHVGAHEYGVT